MSDKLNNQLHRDGEIMKKQSNSKGMYKHKYNSSDQPNNLDLLDIRKHNAEYYYLLTDLQNKY